MDQRVAGEGKGKEGVWVKHQAVGKERERERVTAKLEGQKCVRNMWGLILAVIK